MADDLTPPGTLEDDAGRYFSPLIERQGGVPTAVPVPTAQQIRAMSAEEMSAVMTRYGWEDSWDARVEVHSKFLADFNIRPGDPRYEAEIADLDNNIRRSMLGATRRVAQRTELLFAVDGDPNVMTIYIPEGDNPCPGCLKLAGSQMTYADRVANGAMPADQCDGKDACQCDIGIFT